MKRIFLVVGLCALLASCGSSESKSDKEQTEKEDQKIEQEKIVNPKQSAAKLERKVRERQGWHQYPINGWDLYLYGDVESVEEIGYTYRKGTDGEIIENKADSRTVTKFNRLGDVIEKNYYSDGSLPRKTIYEYNSENKLIEKSVYNSDGSLNYQTIYKYDFLGNMIEESEYNSIGSLCRQTIYKYDSLGKLIEESEYNSNGHLDKSVTYVYDTSSLILKCSHERWVASGSHTYYYNSLGNVEKAIYYNSDETIDYEGVYTYDENGNKLRRELIRDGEVFRIDKFSYNAAGYVISETECRYKNSDSRCEMLTFKYDNAGNRIETCKYHDGTFYSKVEYIYDSHGNMIKLILHSGNAMILKSEFKITYRD